MAKMDFKKLLTAIDSTSTKKNYATEDSSEYWTLTSDKAGNGSAIIRFLPDQDLEQFPFARIFSHGFKNEATGRWYIENSLTTLGQNDPIGELNQKLWNSGDESDKEQARKQKRRLSYVSNIIVLKDPANPDNEGKVFKFKYGKKIFDKITAAAMPEFEDESEVNVFDPEEGANFKLRAKMVAGYKNYDDSSFDSAKPLFGGDSEKIDAVLKKCYNLQELVAPKNFKTYDELKSKLAWVMGEDEKRTTAKAEREIDDELSEEAPKERIIKEATRPKPPVVKATTEDDDEEFFKSLLD